MRYDFGYFEEGKLGRVRDLGLWQRILTFLGPYWKGAVAASLLSLGVVATGLVLPYLIRLGVDDYILQHELPAALRFEGLGRLALVFILLMGLNFLCNFLQVLILEWTGQHVMHKLRQSLFSHLVSLDLPFFDNTPSGKLVTRLTNDIQNMHEMFTSVIVTLFNDLIKLAAILVILFWLNSHLAFLMTLLIPIMLLNTVWFSRLAREAFRSIRTSLARINSFLQESLAGLSVIQSYGREDDSLSGFEHLNDEYKDNSIYQIKIFAIFMPLIELMSGVTIGLIIWYGGSQIIAGEMTIGILVAFLAYMRLFFQPLRELSQKYSIVQSALASAERIFELLDIRPSLSGESGGMRPTQVKGEIVFDKVTFAYEDSHPVLEDFSLSIAPGEIVAIVGATGSGKTTVINLLERFYEPGSGRILFDGRAINTLDQHWLRRQIGLVMQDVFVLPGSVHENVTLDSDLAKDALTEVMKKARLSEMVAALPEGMETIIGEGGHALSSGQRQLLSFARVFARDPKVLILDEATSHVDSVSEQRIEQAIDTSLSGRTSIVIAHRLSTIRRANRIIVMDKGRIVEQGSHPELVAKKGYFYRLLRLQEGLFNS